MSRMIGTVARGVRAPIIRAGDDLAKIVPESVLAAAQEAGFQFHDRDVVAMTEAIVARAQGNYAKVSDIAEDVRAKLGGGTVGVIFPILSRNRFAVCLRGIAAGAKKIVLMLSYPSDEVGNHLIDEDLLDEKGIDPYKDVLSLEKYRELFGYTVHPFTGVDYVAYYMDLIRESGAEVEVVFANDARAILPYTKNVINCDIHTRKRTKRRLLKAGAERVFSLDEILTAPVNGSGYNENYGLLGSNKATEDTVKLFPRDCQGLVEDIQAKLLAATGKHIEVMVYGDGAFKDPVAEEAFIFGCTAVDSDDISIKFDVDESHVGMTFTFGDQATVDEDDQAAVYAELILASVCDSYEKTAAPLTLSLDLKADI